MSRLIACSVASVVITLTAAGVRAQNGLVATPPPRSSTDWTYDARIGYAYAFTTGQSFMGPGAGLALGATLPARVHFEVGAMLYAGSIESGVARPMSFRSHQSSGSAYASAGYEFMPYPVLTIRPSVLAGAILLATETRLGARTVREVTPLVMVGPALAILGRTHGFHFGIDFQAAFVPARVAAPIVVSCALFGVER